MQLLIYIFTALITIFVPAYMIFININPLFAIIVFGIGLFFVIKILER